MCIGLPLRVVETQGHCAWCEAGAHRECLDMMLVGEQPVGTWVLGFLGTARQVLSDEEAAQVLAGRQALAAVLRGDGRVDEFFADLVGRVPELPAHLRTSRQGHLKATTAPWGGDTAGVSVADKGNR
jgi:hydrogenase expression/formation protein HypC